MKQRIHAGFRYGALALILLSAPTFAQSDRAAVPLIPGGDAGAPIIFNAAKFEYFEKVQTLVYSGNVVARQGEATLKASAMTVFLQIDALPGGGGSAGVANNRIFRIEANGPVVITSKDQAGTSDRGVYDKPSNRFYLIGNPVLTHGRNVLRGAPGGMVEYDLTTRGAKITRSTSLPNLPDGGGFDGKAN